MPKAKASKQKKKPSPAGPKAAQAPVATSIFRRTAAPHIQTVQALHTRIAHRELVGDICAYDDHFNVQQFRLNPGLAGTFPWLSATANRYEMYKFHFLSFEYVPRVSATQSGTITMAVDFDANDELPACRADMVSYLGAQSSSVWEPMTMRFAATQLNRAYTERFTRLGQHSGLDLKTYDVGFLTVSVTGAEREASARRESAQPLVVNVISPGSSSKPGSSTSAVGALPSPTLTVYTPYAVGELYVVYDVELLIPQKRVQVAEGAIRQAGTDLIPVAHVLEQAYASSRRGTLPFEIVEADQPDYTANLLRFVARFVGRVTAAATADADPTGGHDGFRFESVESSNKAVGIPAISDSYYVSTSDHRLVGEQVIDGEPGMLMKLVTTGVTTLASLMLLVSSHRRQDYVEL